MVPETAAIYGDVSSTGVLDRTIRHELVHVMTNGVLSGRRLWVKEGAAIYFAGQTSAPEPNGARSASRR